MSALTTWITKRKKAVASTLVVALVAGVPLTIAALHPGFPVTDVDLTARDVWVTNGEQLQGGRLNRQIEELNASVVASSSEFDVLQNGDTLFMVDPVGGRVESVSPSTTEVTSSIDVPVGSEVDYGGDVLAIVSPEGDLWMTGSVGDLVFNYAQTDPLVRLGDGGHAVVTKAGAVIAVSPEEGAAYRIESLGAEIVETEFPEIGAFELTAVGDEAVALDTTTSTVVKEDGTVFELEHDGLRIQQAGPANEAVYVASGDALLEVDLGSGETVEHAASIETPLTSPEDASAPVFLDGCAHGAWAGAQRYLLACEGAEGQAQEITEPTAGNTLEFRVNRSVIALNNLTNGNTWLVDDNMRLVDNWEDVTPPEEADGVEGDEKSATQSLSDTLAERTENNRPPTATDDEFGVRPEKTTILPVLDNDTDPDGDILVISRFDDIASSTGKLDPIDGGRALQFTPSEDFVGNFAFSYTVDDGRGGTDSARVTVNVRPPEINELPESQRLSATTAEANQQITYNVLNDWLDPDGDDLYLVGASPRSGDLVQFTPDGYVTFSHRTSEIGVKEVTVQVSDGIGDPVEGVLTVDVQATGSLSPIGTPDFAETFTGEPVVVEPLDNDLSPSGAQLSLSSIAEPGRGATASLNADQGTVTFSAPTAGIYYVTYMVSAGGMSSESIIRVDVTDKIDDERPPIAVKDTAYLRGDAPTIVSVLSNDTSPSGRVLAVQSLDVDDDLLARGLVVELLESTLIRVTSPQALTEQVSFSYTISDGANTATAGVTVVPVPPLTKHQPPIANDDTATVREGDIVTVDVLENDYHPDDVTMSVEEELVSEPAEGLAFVNANTVRFQAPDEPGQYSVDYSVVDPYGETSAANVLFTVTPVDEDANQEPVPEPLTARVLSGGSIRVEIPLDGIDPDGDSAQLLGFPVNPTLGTIVDDGIDYFVYEAVGGLAGTDEFSYEVYDAFGATGIATVKIAVIPEPTESLPPNAVPDSVAVRPGRVAQVDVTANDSDPQGAAIKVEDELIDVPDDIPVEVERSQTVIIEAPDEEMSFSFRYELTNNLGGSSVSYVQVQVTPDAPILPPSADDIIIDTADIAGEQSISVDIYDNVFNPGGRNSDLAVSLEGPNASSAEVLDGGRVEVTPGETRQAIAYRVTDDVEDLDAMAFIIVPAATGEEFDDPPIIDPSLPVQYIDQNETKEWDLSEIVFVPSGRDVIITDPASVSAVQSNGDSNYVDEDTIRFTPPLDYRGPAAINFTVTDGSNPNDPNGNVSSLRLNIIVGDPESRDVEPTFTSPSVEVEAGESATIDLRESTGHPNPQILQEITYSDITGASEGLQVEQAGSTLTLSAPIDAVKGTASTLGVTLRWGDFEVPGTVNVTVVSSSRPLAVAVSDSAEAARGDGATVVPVLANDSNPFQSTGQSLRVIDANVDNSGEPASVTFTEDSVRIAPNPNLKSGEIVVIYRIADATNDPDREVNGTVSLVVSDVPDAVAKPVRQPNNEIGADGTATWVFQAPATNGKPITSYDITVTPAISNPPTCTAGARCTLTGLTNGTAYRISAAAENMRGRGGFSPQSDPITPFGTPGTPEPTKTTQSKWSPANITWSWPAVDARGGSTTYFWELNSGQKGQGTSTSATVSGLGPGTYTLSVYARNSGGRDGQTGTSAPAEVRQQPTPNAVRNLSARASRPTANADLTFSWNPPNNATADAAGDGLRYRWSVNTGGSGTGTATTVNLNGKGQGNHTITVVPFNDSGDGPAQTASVRVDAPPPPARNPSVEPRRGDGRVGQQQCGSWSCAYPAMSWNDVEPGSYNLCYTLSGNDAISGCQRVNIASSGSHQFTGQGFRGWPNNTLAVRIEGVANASKSWGNSSCLNTGSGCRNGP
ncbi:Ig-like domain-containing protein [Marisediminicola sp. LYQ134]|uniref:Ig-like domain-containing protein n=1 Tax=Marisediminicola sp. LYQ134 TaxID=3391061 RepID=UPI00398308B0